MQPDLTSLAVLQEDLGWHARECFADVTNDSQLIMDFSQMSCYCLCVASKLEASGAEWFESYTRRHVTAMKGITCVQSLRAYHGPSCSLLIKQIILGMVLFQWRYQSLCPAMGFSIQLSSVNFGVSGLSNAKQLVSPDCHFCILKELCSSVRVHFYSALTHSWSCPHTSWQVSLILCRWASIQRLPLLSLQEAHMFFWYFLQVFLMDTWSISEDKTQSPEAVFRSESFTISFDDSESQEV